MVYLRLYVRSKKGGFIPSFLFSGDLSILPKAEYKPLTPKDMKINVDKSSLCANVIIDGKIMDNNLKMIGKSSKWLFKQLKQKKYNDISQLLLVTIDNQKKINIYEKNKDISSFDILE